MVPTAGDEAPRRLTSGERDSSPRWSPDGKYLVFTRVTEKDGKTGTAAAFHALDGGRRRLSFHRSAEGRGRSEVVAGRKVDRLHQHDQSRGSGEAGKEKAQRRRIEKAAAEASPRRGKQRERRRKRKRRERKRSMKATFRSSPARSIAGTMKAISISNARNISGSCRRRGAPTRKSQPKTTDERPFRRRRRRLVERRRADLFHFAAHVDEPYYELPKTELYSIPASGGEATNCSRRFDMDTGGFALSPDGKQIAFIAVGDAAG